MTTDKWIAGAHDRAHRGLLRDLVAERYGPDGFMRSRRTGHVIIRPRVLRVLRSDPDPHVRGMASFALNVRGRAAARRTADRRSPLRNAAGHLGGK